MMNDIGGKKLATCKRQTERTVARKISHLRVGGVGAHHLSITILMRQFDVLTVSVNWLNIDIIKYVKATEVSAVGLATS